METFTLNEKITAKGIAERVLAGTDPFEARLQAITKRTPTPFEINLANEFYGHSDPFYNVDINKLGADGYAMMFDCY